MFSSARSGAIQGLLAGIAYWSVESFLLHILPRLGEPGYLYTPPNAGFTAMLLGLYAAAGLAIGAIAGIALGAWAETRLRAVLTSVLCLAIAASVFPRLPRGLPAWSESLLFLPVGLSLLVSLVSAPWGKRLAFLANPWIAAAVLAGLPVIVSNARSKITLASAALSLLPLAAGSICLYFLTRTIARAAIVAALLLAACCVLHQEPRRTPHTSFVAPAADKPDVILITLDTVRADHLSLYGYERDTSPNLKKLSQEATVYTQAISPGDMTLSSHASIFTGLYPSWHQAHFDAGYEWGRPLDESYQTLAGTLSAKGFDTAAIVANYLYLAPGFGLDRGFTYHDSSAPVPRLGATKPFLIRERVRNVLIRFAKPWEYDAIFRRAGEINAAALPVLDDEKSRGRKFFCFLNYMDAHWPYLPPERFSTLYPGFDPRIKTGYYSDIEKQVLTLKRPLSDRERRHLVSQYDGAIAYMDRSLGQLIDGLKQRGLYDNTLLIITGDHGEAFGERGILGHALSVYQDLVHVPLVIKYPRQSSQAVIDRPVSLVDLLPTILETLGYPIPKYAQGQSLARPAAEVTRDVISETFVHPLMSTWHPRFDRSEQAVFSGSLKWIEASNGGRELYDLSQDPNEEHNLFPEQRPAGLEVKLSGYLKAAAMMERKRAAVRASSQSVEKLKSLGYIRGN